MQVVELHDCFSCNELITYEALGLCEEGKWLSIEEFVVRALLPIQIIEEAGYASTTCIRNDKLL